MGDYGKHSKAAQKRAAFNKLGPAGSAKAGGC
jgi:hypothetical protein